MKRYNDSNYWYLMTAGPDQAGKVTRYYVVECCKCGASKSHHATSLSDEQLRKIFMRDGWEIGKWRNGHRCPGCKHKKKPVPVLVPQPVPVPPPVVIATLDAAWQAATEDERSVFVAKLMLECEALMRPSPAVPPNGLNGHAEPELIAEIQAAPEPEPIIEDDDTPADWWLELEKRNAS